MIELRQAEKIYDEMIKPDQTRDVDQLCVLFLSMQVAQVAQQIGKLERAVSKLNEVSDAPIN